MNGRIYCFNPAHDMALANNTPFYKAPDEIVRMAYDLAVLPGWYGRQNAKVKIDEPKQAELLRSQTDCEELFPDMEWTLKWESCEYVPWGWDPSLLHTLRLAGVDEDFLLTDPQMERIRCLSGRQQCIRILEALRPVPAYAVKRMCAVRSMKSGSACLKWVRLCSRLPGRAAEGDWQRYLHPRGLLHWKDG